VKLQPFNLLMQMELGDIWSAKTLSANSYSDAAAISAAWDTQKTAGGESEAADSGYWLRTRNLTVSDTAAANFGASIYAKTTVSAANKKLTAVIGTLSTKPSVVALAVIKQDGTAAFVYPTNPTLLEDDLNDEDGISFFRIAPSGTNWTSQEQSGTINGTLPGINAITGAFQVFADADRGSVEFDLSAFNGQTVVLAFGVFERQEYLPGDRKLQMRVQSLVFAA
jgi:hypothetical protein